MYEWWIEAERTLISLLSMRVNLAFLSMQVIVGRIIRDQMLIVSITFSYHNSSVTVKHLENSATNNYSASLSAQVDQIGEYSGARPYAQQSEESRDSY